MWGIDEGVWNGKGVVDGWSIGRNKGMLGVIERGKVEEVLCFGRNDVFV